MLRISRLFLCFVLISSIITPSLNRAQTNVTTKKEPYIKIKKEEELLTLLEKIAHAEKQNIIYPYGGEQITQKINFGRRKRLPLSQAKRYASTLLELAGYAISTTSSALIIQKLNENNITRRGLPLFVNVNPELLPNTDEHIRALYFLTNFRTPESATSNDPINLLIRDSLGTQTSYFYDQKTNSIILTGSSRKIASTMNLVLKLDQTGSPEKIEEIPLFNASATMLAKLIGEQLIAAAKGQMHSMRPTIKTHEDLYFAPNTRVIANKQNNSLIVIGQESSINRIRKLVYEHLDQQKENGNSILHVYELQYLDSKSFANVLTKIVQSTQGQSKKDFSGPEQYFDEVIIVAEEETSKAGQRGGSFSSGLTIGGNRLIIACSGKDWPRIKALIEQLDKPQLQIAIQILIADLTFIGKKELKAHTRNPLALDKNNLLPYGFTYQSGHISSIAVDPLPSTGSITPQTLAADLLKLVTTTGAADMALSSTTGPNNYGSMIISLADKTNNTIWGVLKLLDRWIESKVVTQVIVTVKNNEETTASSTVVRRKEGTSDGQTVNTTIPLKDFDATTSVTIKPRISSLDRITLQVNAKVESFTDEINFTRKTQEVKTSASMQSGDIWVLGGLAKINDSESNTQWPILGSIPIIGNLFKGNAQTREKSNLAIFIHPTVIDPKLRAGFNQLTDELIEQGKEIIQSGELFSNLKDPVTMLYFSSEHDVTGSELFAEYHARSNNQKEPKKSNTATLQDWEREGLKRLAELRVNPLQKN